MADLPSSGRRLIEAKQSFQELKIQFEEAKRKYRAIEADFWTMLDEELGVTTVTLDLGEPHGKVQLQKRETIKARVLDAEAAAAAVKALGLADALISEEPAFRQKVLNEHMRDWLKDGAIPPEGIDFTTTRFVSVTSK